MLVFGLNGLLSCCFHLSTMVCLLVAYPLKYCLLCFASSMVCSAFFSSQNQGHKTTKFQLDNHTLAPNHAAWTLPSTARAEIQEPLRPLNFQFKRKITWRCNNTTQRHVSWHWLFTRWIAESTAHPRWQGIPRQLTWRRSVLVWR